jgi:hypothetical protein
VTLLSFHERVIVSVREQRQAWPKTTPFVYRGERIHPGLRPVRVYPQGRVCGAQGCDTLLSIYNGSDFCWVHTAVSFRHVVNGRRGRKKAA